ncbi:glycosyltransferase family 4 protein [Rhodovulum sulfidophilum]|uniref:glycosyltransferase family 4 protein n=1 Tax=Rhodovulum sulfidophilum TaxID=35806 RepID=UPI001920F180|nr:glycosyltransferase family 4 protein [Rhodovulum sulfidophilum]MBL3594267.1 glycosyltransferase family 4 protein [Rhodovulum sulfidophilum]
MRVVFVQHGNYAEAYRRMCAGEAETYRDQFRSVSLVAGLAAAGPVVTVALGDAHHDAQLAPNLRSVGLPRADIDRAGSLLDDLAPDRLVCRTPHTRLLAAAAARGIATLPCFADMMRPPSPLGLWRHWRLRNALRARTVPCVANHSLNASRSLVEAGLISAEHVVPWDWSRLVPNPDPKPGMPDPQNPTILFAGKMTVEKGLGDVLAAMSVLAGQGLNARLTVAGGGDVRPWQAEAARLGLAERVDFLGLVPNTEIRHRMRAYDIVVVPSRHDYPEGLPNTIYEGLASRSVLMLSDHPAFRGRVEPGRHCLMFRAGNPAALGAEIRKLCAAPELYAHLSRQAPEALDSLYVGLAWGDLVTYFLDDPANLTGWVERHSLCALGLSG